MIATRFEISHPKMFLKRINYKNLAPKTNKRQPKLVTFLVFTLFLCIISVFYSMLLINRETVEVISRAPKVHLDYVIVHIDLKGMPPTLNYLGSLLPVLKRSGVNGLLMEYEDMFPYEGLLRNLTSEYFYKKIELRSFLEDAVNLGFEIIPLIQTFGHMEFVLKHYEFVRLRENPYQPDSICPTRPQSIDVITEMLTQIILFHTDIAPLKYVHIGCDEVYQMNSCRMCRNRSMTNLDLYMSHVNTVTKIVRTLSAKTKVLIWNDMLFNMNQNVWQKTKSLENIDVVYWNYRPNETILHAGLYQQHKLFSNIWIASAFKGADGPNEIIPNIINRAMNTYSWMKNIKDYKFGGENNVYNFKGIFLTGWSKYNHFSANCDLLVSAIPSLMIDLRIVALFRSGKYDPDSDFIQFMDDVVRNYLKLDLNCNQDISLKSLQAANMPSCNFQENIAYSLATKYSKWLHNMTKDLKKKVMQLRYEVGIENDREFQTWCSSTQNAISAYRINMKNAFAPYYDNEILEEYVHLQWLNAKQKITLCFIKNSQEDVKSEESRKLKTII